MHVFIVDFLFDFEGSKLQFVDTLSLPRPPFLLDFAPLFDSVLTARNDSSANTKKDLIMTVLTANDIALKIIPHR